MHLLLNWNWLQIILRYCWRQCPVKEIIQIDRMRVRSDHNQRHHCRMLWKENSRAKTRRLRRRMKRTRVSFVSTFPPPRSTFKWWCPYRTDGANLSVWIGDKNIRCETMTKFRHESRSILTVIVLARGYYQCAICLMRRMVRCECDILHGRSGWTNANKKQTYGLRVGLSEGVCWWRYEMWFANKI